jgi:hypothetical protein
MGSSFMSTAQLFPMVNAIHSCFLVGEELTAMGDGQYYEKCVC